jgi:hypothetical protein
MTKGSSRKAIAEDNIASPSTKHSARTGKVGSSAQIEVWQRLRSGEAFDSNTAK